MLRFGSTPAEMREMSEDDVYLSRLQLLIVMSKAYIESHPLGAHRKEAVIKNAQEVAKNITSLRSEVKSKEEMDSDYIFRQRVELLAVMAKAFAEGHPMGQFRKEALEDNVDYISEAITFDSQTYDMKFLKVA